MMVRLGITIAFVFLTFLALVNCYQVELMSKGSSSATLEWSVSYSNSEIMMTLYLPIKMTQGGKAFGLAISDSKQLIDADALVILTSNESVIIRDCWINRNQILNCDENQDFTMTSYSKNDSFVQIGLNRAINTCDDDDYAFDSGTTILISVLMSLPGELNKREEEVFNFSTIDVKNSATKITLVQILKSKPYEAGDEKYSSFDIVAPNLTIPARPTTYSCSVHLLPPFKQKVHGIGYESFISSASQHLIHHIEVFLCDPKDVSVPYYVGNCESESKPKELDRCKHVLAAWAYGAKAFFYPKEAGLPLGNNLGTRYVRLEIHYNNPTMISDVIDSSGIRFFYTRSLRQYDVGVMEIGVTYTSNMAIPPRQPSFTWSGRCPSACTQEALPPGGIKVFASELHTHVIGRKVWTSRYRGNQSLPDIARDDHYTTWFEEIRYINPPALILPGDELVTNCAFDSSERSKATVGGLGVEEEMCVDYLHYYPAANLEVCKSSIAAPSIRAFLTLESLRSSTKRKVIPSTVTSAYKQITWTAQTVRELKLLYRYAPLDVHCLKHNGDSWSGKFQGLKQLDLPPSWTVPDQRTNKTAKCI